MHLKQRSRSQHLPRLQYKLHRHPFIHPFIRSTTPYGRIHSIFLYSLNVFFLPAHWQYRWAWEKEEVEQVTYTCKCKTNRSQADLGYAFRKVKRWISPQTDGSRGRVVIEERKLLSGIALTTDVTLWLNKGYGVGATSSQQMQFSGNWVFLCKDAQKLQCAWNA